MKFGLAHGGGGTRGFARLGVAQALHEIEVPIDCAKGTFRDSKSMICLFD